MASFDYFVGALECPVCQKVSKADFSTNMQTKIRDEPKMAELGVGSSLEITLEKAVLACYLPVQPMPLEGEVRLLDTWECPYCSSPFNWAEIVVSKGLITSVLAVPLNRETLERVHFISDDCIYVLMAMINRPYEDILKEDTVKILLEQLQLV